MGRQKADHKEIVVLFGAGTPRPEIRASSALAAVADPGPGPSRAGEHYEESGHAADKIVQISHRIKRWIRMNRL